MGFDIVGQEHVHETVKSKMKIENIDIADADMLNFIMKNGLCVINQPSGEKTLEMFCEKIALVTDDDGEKYIPKEVWLTSQMELEAYKADNQMLSTENFTICEQNNLLQKIQVASVKQNNESTPSELQLLHVQHETINEYVNNKCFVPIGKIWERSLYTYQKHANNIAMQTRYQVSAGPVLIGDLFNEVFRYLSIRFNYITLSPSQQFEKSHMISQEINSLTI